MSGSVGGNVKPQVQVSWQRAGTGEPNNTIAPARKLREESGRTLVEHAKAWVKVLVAILEKQWHVIDHNDVEVALTAPQQRLV